MNSVFIHGFLGLPSDWERIAFVPKNATKISLWDDLKLLGTNASFDIWSTQFLETTSPGVKAYGYSLGGRLLLHAYLKNPEHFESLHLFSTNYGLKTGKQERIVNDLKWAERFLKEDWSTLIPAWNAQPVFNQSPEFVRREADFDRKLLAKALDVFSLGRQDDLLPRLQQLITPIHYVVGERDERFVTLLNAIPSQNNLFCYILADSGHRIPWNYPMTGQEKWWL